MRAFSCIGWSSATSLHARLRRLLGPFYEPNSLDDFSDRYQAVGARASRDRRLRFEAVIARALQLVCKLFLRGLDLCCAEYI